MFKALNKHTNEEIVILAPHWRGRIGTLRSLDAQDALVCQGCLQPVRVRAGVLKRWHFAHKHLQNCIYEFESPVVLHCRAVLYEWLIGQFGEGDVTIEKKCDLFRPVDCWVYTPTGSIGYWLIDSRMPPQERSSLAAALVNACTHPVWVFTYPMLHSEENNPERLYLTTTEREFMRHTPMDEPVQSTYHQPGSSLYYFDSDRETLVTFRGLQVFHPPQLYSGFRHENLLNQVRASSTTGDFIHPGEDERTVRYQSAILERSHQQQKTEQRITIKMAELFGNLKEKSTARRGESNLPPSEAPGDAHLPRCVFCGRATDDYWYINHADHTCKCRDCYRQGKYE